MKQNHDSNSARPPVWIRGSGQSPSLKWHFQCPDRLLSAVLARESGDIFAACENGQLFRIDRNGQLLATLRFDDPITAIDWSDQGQQGAVLIGTHQLIRLDAELQTLQTIALRETGLGVAVSPYGGHIAVGLENGTTLIYSDRKRPIAEFETIRPLTFLEFCSTEPVLFGAAEHGLICCHNLQGALIWQQSNWSNSGRMRSTGTGDLIYLASFGQGIQTFDGDGNSVGTYALEGTTSRVDCTFQAGRLIGATVEQTLHWMQSNGNVTWTTTLDDQIAEVICDPLGTWAVCGTANNGLYCLSWPA